MLMKPRRDAAARLDDSRRGPATVRLVVLASLLLAGGCSVVQFTYNRADWLALRKLDAYLDLEDTQYDSAARRFEARLEAHRRYELPEYVRLLHSLRRDVENGLDHDEVRTWLERLHTVLASGIERTIPTVVPSMVGLSDEQMAHFARHIDRRDAQYRKKYLGGDRGQRTAARVQRVTKRIEHWTGPLAPAQRELVAGHVEGWPDTANDWLDYRRDRQRRLLELIEAGTDPEMLAQFLHDWWVRLDGLAEATDRLLADIGEMVVAVDATLSAAQRDRVLSRLDRYIRDMQALHGEGCAVVSSKPETAATQK